MSLSFLHSSSPRTWWYRTCGQSQHHCYDKQSSKWEAFPFHLPPPWDKSNILLCHCKYWLDVFLWAVYLVQAIVELLANDVLQWLLCPCPEECQHDRSDRCQLTDLNIEGKVFQSSSVRFSNMLGMVKLWFLFWSILKNGNQMGHICKRFPVNTTPQSRTSDNKLLWILCWSPPHKMYWYHLIKLRANVFSSGTMLKLCQCWLLRCHEKIMLMTITAL